MDEAEARRVGLCATCQKVKVVESARGSRFYLCTAPELPKYPQLPKRACPLFIATAAGADGGR